jgi:hypothetical protein
VVLAVAEVAGADGEPDPDVAGVPDDEDVPVDEAEADVLVPLLELGAGEEALGESLADEELLGEGSGEGEGVGDGVGVGDDVGDGVGEGEAVAEDGSAWHLVSVGRVAAPAARAAWALPTRPRVRKPPLSKLTAATRTCAKRIKIACLRCSSGLRCSLRDFGGDWWMDGSVYSYPVSGYICIDVLPILAVDTSPGSARSPASSM